jgi:hypothetical protein
VPKKSFFYNKYNSDSSSSSSSSSTYNYDNYNNDNNDNNNNNHIIILYSNKNKTNYKTFDSVTVVSTKNYSQLFIPEGNDFFNLLTFCRQRIEYAGNKCLFNSTDNPIAMFNNYGEEQFQTLLSFKKKIVINNHLPDECYDKELKAFVFHALGKSKQYSGHFVCNFQNNELKYDEINISLNKTTDNLNFNKYKFLYNIDGEFCCIVSIINNSFKIMLY